MTDGLDAAALARAITELAAWARDHAQTPDSGIADRLTEHFGEPPGGYPVVSEPLGLYDRVNVQVALDAWLAEPGRAGDVIGLLVPGGMEISMSQLAQPSKFGWSPEPGPVRHVAARVGADTIPTLDDALVLCSDGEDRLALLFVVSDRGFESKLVLEVLAPTRERGERFLADLRALRAERNVYRGRIIEFGGTEDGQAVTVRDVPEIPRERIVLPDEAFGAIERHTIGVSEHAEALLGAGRHLKRGLLLHGPPGTGKTLTAMHLARRMRDRTTVLLTGQSFGGLDTGVELARALQPSMVVMEDVDLIAEDRDFDPDDNPLLFELLNAMEGLQDDADIIFVLTTNRPEVLERALVQRPGRIDLAVELPLPDAEGRLRLLTLYAEGLDVEAAALAEMVQRTDGVSPAFIRELLRRAALNAALDGDARRVTDAHLHAAMDELERSSAGLTSRVLGGKGSLRILDEDELLDDDEDLLADEDET